MPVDRDEPAADDCKAHYAILHVRLSGVGRFASGSVRKSHLALPTLRREHRGVELPEDTTLILETLFEIRTNVRWIVSVLEEDDDEEGDEEEAP